MISVDDLTNKLLEDGKNHPRKGVRRRCTPERCRRVAERAVANAGANTSQLMDLCAQDEPEAQEKVRSGHVATDGFGFAWIALLLPLLQIVLQFLAQRAIAHLNT